MKQRKIIYENAQQNLFVSSVKKAPPKNMTLSEIEKTLGYSVNIVTEDEREEIKDK